MRTERQQTLRCLRPVALSSQFANYEYGLFWYFYLDGTIQLEMKLTGILSTSVCGLNEVSARSSLYTTVSPTGSCLAQPSSSLHAWHCTSQHLPLDIPQPLLP